MGLDPDAEPLVPGDDAGASFESLALRLRSSEQTTAALKNPRLQIRRREPEIHEIQAIRPQGFREFGV
jgi:hypothetical protein